MPVKSFRQKITFYILYFLNLLFTVFRIKTFFHCISSCIFTQKIIIRTIIGGGNIIFAKTGFNVFDITVVFG